MKNLINLSKTNKNNGTNLTEKYSTKFIKKEESFPYLNFKTTVKSLLNDLNIKNKLWSKTLTESKIKKNNSYKNSTLYSMESFIRTWVTKKMLSKLMKSSWKKKKFKDLSLIVSKLSPKSIDPRLIHWKKCKSNLLLNKKLNPSKICLKK